MTSLLLDTVTWDLCIDAFGNIAACAAPYAIAQDVACAARTFIGDCYYVPSTGIPYFGNILGKQPSIPFLKAQYVAAALAVPQVAAAQCFITGISNRVLSGQIQFTDTSGEAQVVGF